MRGRDAIAVAFRSPDGGIVWETERLDSGFHGSRWSRLPFIRGLVVLYETLVVGTRWLVRSASLAASEEGVELGRGAVALMLGVTLAAGIGVFFLLPLIIATVTTSNIDNGFVQHFVEGSGPDRDLHRLPGPDRPGQGRPARLPVPRRRAHDDPCLGGGRPADDRRGPQVPDGASALRHRVPRRRDRLVDPDVQPRRAADPGRDDRQPDPAHPGHRRGRLRAAPVRRAAPWQSPRPGDHDARASGSRRSRPASRPTT